MKHFASNEKKKPKKHKRDWWGLTLIHFNGSLFLIAHGKETFCKQRKKKLICYSVIFFDNYNCTSLNTSTNRHRNQRICKIVLYFALLSEPHSSHMCVLGIKIEEHKWKEDS